MLNRKLRIHAPAIYYFDMVRRCHSIREAARRLNVASSAVNRQILKLEDEMGAALFERLPGGLRVTAAGEILTRHVTLLLQDVERVRGELDGLHGVQTGMWRSPPWKVPPSSCYRPPSNACASAIRR